MAVSPERLAQLYREACELELQAFKPGNVSVYADGHDMTVADFRISAEVSATPLCHPGYCLGEKIYYAVKATQEAVACNTNLGIILLAAPLLQATLNGSGLTLRESLRQVLSATTVTDADWVFRAIALASPGGLGKTQEQDVHAAATVTLKAAMGLASDKDRIALQYLTDYEDIFDFAILYYYNAMNIWKSKSWSGVAVYTTLLSRFPDSHIERKYGKQYSGMIMQTMGKLSRALATPMPEQVMPLLYQVDQELKAKRINPGTTADMTVATLLAVLLQEEWT
ncbi:triphosphoribosyl-dephospho-CoA synthase [Methylovulum miyakonense]|uniref:triphosphoribosyl-dephospho-CoA synthase n=1 Tax=Methylovulum miyakonense TaxID=645578 RepID=UPI00037442F0|nr:triphosphoribosyl-dephospho-CoA synthase [Methylovulum miyakonense]